MAFIRLEHVSKSFLTKSNAVTPALRDVTLEVGEGDFVTIVGPSGCGKSTTLNLLAGLTEPTSGTVLVAGRPVGQAQVDTGYVFQQDSVLPWRKVIDNVEIGLKLRGVPAAERRARAMALLQTMGLGDFAQAFPAELSGGMRKRAALAATLVYHPQLLLMDEPFGALDAQTRIILQGELLRLWSEQRATVLFVTHDIGEAILLADRVVVMTARPARVKAEYTVHLPRPRDPAAIKFGPEFQALYERVWADLQPEIAEQSRLASVQ